MLIFLLNVVSASKMEPFIVGGQEASIESWPFIAFMEVSVFGSFATACGGSLISSQTVLTAAHCLDDYTKKKQLTTGITFTIYMGHSSYLKASMTRDALDYETHKDYSPHDEDIRYDIGVMFLKRPVGFSANVQKAILQRSFSFKRDKHLMVAGWGFTDPDGKNGISKNLKVAAMTSKNYKMCKDMYRVVCAATDDGEYPFAGDSGSPVVLAGSRYQIGILSFMNLNTGTSVFTSIPAYWDWISTHQLKLFRKFCGRK